jgi:hypothetical protein
MSVEKILIGMALVKQCALSVALLQQAMIMHKRKPCGYNTGFYLIFAVGDVIRPLSS